MYHTESFLKEILEFLDYLDFLLQLFLYPSESSVLQQDTGGHFLPAPAFVLPVETNKQTKKCK